MGTITNLFRRPQGDFDALMAPHIDQLYRLAYRFTGNRHDAEDLVQDLLIRLYPKRNDLAEMEQLRPFLTRSLYNLFIDLVRRNRRDPEGVEAAEPVADPGHGPEMQAEGTLLQRHLMAALEMLNPDQRALLSLHDMEGYSLPELEVLLETPLGTLKSRLHRARARMREILETAGVMEPFGDEQRFVG